MELSFGEIVVLVVLAFVVLGPNELVRQSQRIGRFIAKLKTEANNFRILAEEEIIRAAEIKSKMEVDLNASIIRDEKAQRLAAGLPEESEVLNDPHAPKTEGGEGQGGPKGG